MAIIFNNGGAPASSTDAYSGVTVTTTTQLLNQISQTLISAGWVDHNPGSGSDNFTLKGTRNGNFCYFLFQVLNSTTLEIRGDATGDGSILSEKDRILIDIVDNQDNTIFVTADDGAFGIASLPFSGDTTIVHGGYTRTLNPNDATCIYLGIAITLAPPTVYKNITQRRGNGYSIAMVHTHFNPTPNADNPSGFEHWESVEKGFVPTTSTYSSPNDSTAEMYSLPYYTIFNKNSLISESGSTIKTATSSNTNYWAHIGDNDPISNSPLASSYYYLESPTEYNNYGDDFKGVNQATVGAFRGDVAFIVTGLSHLPRGSQWNGTDGEVYITGDAGFQGMRIA